MALDTHEYVKSFWIAYYVIESLYLLNASYNDLEKTSYFLMLSISLPLAIIHIEDSTTEDNKSLWVKNNIVT